MEMVHKYRHLFAYIQKGFKFTMGQVLGDTNKMSVSWHAFGLKKYLVYLCIPICMLTDKLQARLNLKEVERCFPRT